MTLISYQMIMGRIILLLIVSLFVTFSVTLMPTDLSEDEILSDYVIKAAKFATDEIHLRKLAKGEYDKCTTLKSQVLTGRKQVASGITYYLQLKVLPVAISSNECHKKNPSSKWQAELCETEVLWQAWKQPDMQLNRSVCLPVED